jgi:hypothetical protein
MPSLTIIKEMPDLHRSFGPIFKPLLTRLYVTRNTVNWKTSKKPGAAGHRAKEDFRRKLFSYRMVLCIAICAPRRDEMNDPTEETGSADP